MAWTRRWRIDSSAKLRRVASAISALAVDPRQPMELVLRSERREKSGEQRKLFHAVIADLAPHLGLTPAATKALVKKLYFGAQFEVVRIGNHELTIEIVPSTEDLDREQYSSLIDFLYRLASEEGIVLADRRPA